MLLPLKITAADSLTTPQPVIMTGRYLKPNKRSKIKGYSVYSLDNVEQKVTFDGEKFDFSHLDSGTYHLNMFFQKRRHVKIEIN